MVAAAFQVPTSATVQQQEHAGGSLAAHAEATHIAPAQHAQQLAALQVQRQPEDTPKPHLAKLYPPQLVQVAHVSPSSQQPHMIAPLSFGHAPHERIEQAFARLQEEIDRWAEEGVPDGAVSHGQLPPIHEEPSYRTDHMHRTSSGSPASNQLPSRKSVQFGEETPEPSWDVQPNDVAFASMADTGRPTTAAADAGGSSGSGSVRGVQSVLWMFLEYTPCNLCWSGRSI